MVQYRQVIHSGTIWRFIKGPLPLRKGEIPKADFVAQRKVGLLYRSPLCAVQGLGTQEQMKPLALDGNSGGLRSAGSLLPGLVGVCLSPPSKDSIPTGT